MTEPELNLLVSRREDLTKMGDEIISSNRSLRVKKIRMTHIHDEMKALLEQIQGAIREEECQ